MSTQGMRRFSRSRGSVGAFGLVALVSVVTSSALTAVALWAPTPTPLQPVSDVGTVGITMTAFDDDREVELEVRSGPAPKVWATAGGVVTATACRVGGTFTSGEQVAVISGRSVRGLATKIPLWRSIKVGLTGADVRAVNNELRRLKRAAVSGPTATVSTVKALAELAGLPPGTRVVPPESLAWLPASRVLVESCPAVVGERVSQGSTLATLVPAASWVGLKARPANAVAGKRNLVINEAILPIDAAGVTTPEALAAVSNTEAFNLWSSSRGQVPLTGHWRLAQPLQAAVVPAAAIAVDGESTCVLAATGPVPVTVVGSSLGRSVITFDRPPPNEVRAVAGVDAKCA